MNVAEQLEYESRVRMRYAVIAFCAALLIVGSQLISAIGPHATVNEQTLGLITVNRRFPVDLISGVIDAAGLLALMVVLGWTHLISRARDPTIRGWIRSLTYAAILMAAATVAYWIVVSIKAHQFATTGNQSYPEAQSLTSGPFVPVVSLLADLGGLILLVAVCWISLNALRVGLVSRPLGYLGVVAGVLVLFPLGALAFFIQGLWLIGMSLLFAGRWPNGSPPAWEQGIAVPWPTAGAARGQRPPPRASRGAGGRARRSDVEAAIRGGEAAKPAALASAETDDAANLRTRANTPKRKRKRRN